MVKPILIPYWVVFVMFVVALALVLWAVYGFRGILANTEDAEICESNGFVWLSGDGVSEPGCYDLERIPME